MDALGALGKLLPKKPLPSVLVSMSLRRQETAAHAPWLGPPPRVLPPRAELCAYEVRAHIYQGRGLPSKDGNGLIDLEEFSQLVGDLRVFREHDVDGNGKLSRVEVRGMRRRHLTLHRPRDVKANA